MKKPDGEGIGSVVLSASALKFGLGAVLGKGGGDRSPLVVGSNTGAAVGRLIVLEVGDWLIGFGVAILSLGASVGRTTAGIDEVPPNPSKMSHILLKITRVSGRSLELAPHRSIRIQLTGSVHKSTVAYYTSSLSCWNSKFTKNTILLLALTSKIRCCAVCSHSSLAETIIGAIW